METVRFQQTVCLNEGCDLRSAAYGCSKPGNQSGEYYRKADVDAFFATSHANTTILDLSVALSKSHYEALEAEVARLKAQLAELRESVAKDVMAGFELSIELQRLAGVE